MSVDTGYVSLYTRTFFISNSRCALNMFQGCVKMNEKWMKEMWLELRSRFVFELSSRYVHACFFNGRKFSFL